MPATHLTRIFTHRILPLAAVAAALGTAALVYHPGQGGSAAATAEPPATARALTVTATDFALDLPERLPAGPVTFSLTNQGSAPHHAIAMRLNGGVSVAQFMDTLPAGPEAVLQIATIHGGPRTVEPGEQSQATLDLPAGQYVFLCLVQDDEGVPHAAKGMTRAVEVGEGATAATATAPQPGVQVTLKDFAFDLPPVVPAGPQTWEVLNTGSQLHELALYTLLPGKSFADLAAYAQNPAGPRPVARVSGVEALSTGARAWLDLDLPPGGYALVCTIPDPATGKEHVDLGMLATFTVAD